MKKTIRYFIVTLMIITAFYIKGIPVSAASVTQTEQTTSSITISWPANEKALEYSVTIGKDYYEVRDATPVTVPAGTTSYTFTGLNAGTQYMVIVKYTYQGFTQPTTGSIGSANVKTLPSKVSGVKQKSWSMYSNGVNFDWNKQPAAAYEYVIRNHKNKVVEKKATLVRPVLFTKAKRNIVYNVQVRAYVTINGKKHYGSWSDKAYLFAQPKIKQLKISKKKLKVTWEKINGVSGYDILISTKLKSGYKKVKSLSSKKTSCTLAKFKGKTYNTKKTYYVYVRAKKKANGKTYTTGKGYTYILKKGKYVTEMSIAS